MLIAYVVRIIRKHPLRPSVGGDAHAVKRSGTSTLGVHRPPMPRQRRGIKPPLCKGRCHGFAVTEGLSPAGGGEPRPYTPSDAPGERPLPLPLGEVAERSEDGEGKQ